MAKNPNNSTMSSFNYGSLKSSMNYSTLSLMSVNTSTNPTANRTFDFNTKDFVFCLTNKSMMANKDLMAAIKHLNPEYTLAETEDDLSHYAQERRKYYFVCDSFKGDLFKLLRKNSCRICAPTFLVYLYHKKRKIPETARPLFNGSMFGVAVCFTGFATKREAVSELADLVHYMGGSVRKDFSGKITHVVANLAQGQKYKAAVNLGKHIMTEEWVMQSWKHRDDMTFKATKPEFVEKYQMKPFYGLKLSFVGFSSEETKHMEELTLDNNGVYVDVGSEDCTHLVVEDTYTSSIPLEALKALHVVKQEWFWTSIQLDACAEESMYFHVSDLGTPLGTGSARLNKKKRKFLNASDLSDLLSPGSPFTSNKRQSKDGGLSMISSATFDSSLGSPFSASNIDSPAEQKEVIKTSLTKRHQTCFELQTTERNYVQVLRTIIKVFKEPIDESANQRGGPLLAAEEVKTIFGSIPDILEVHEKLLDQLDQLLNTWTEEHLIGKAIAECANGMMKTYPGFVNYFDMIKETIVTSDKEKPRFHAFLKVCLTKPDCGRQTLKELLIRPVQRLPSMCLLLKDILKHTSNDNPDHKHLKRAVAAVENVLAYINEDRRKTEHQVQMFEIIRDVDNCPPNILSSHRTLVSKVEGVEVLEGLVLKNDQLIMFLFNDSIEIAKKKSRGTGNNVVMKSPAIQNMRGNQQKAYKHVEFIQLSYLKSVVDIKSDEDEYKDMFGLIYHVPNENRDKLNIYKFTGGSCATKLDWMTIIVKCLAGTKCSNDMENFLVTVDASELLHDKNDLSESKERSASITKVFKKATGGFSKKVSRAFSLNKTPKKSQQDKSADPNLRRAMSSITPINEVGRLPSEVVSPTPSEYTMMDFSVCEEK